MAVNKIRIEKIDRKQGFDTFEFLRNGGALDEQKVAAVFRTIIETVNHLIDENESLKNIILKNELEKSKKKGGGGKPSTKSQ